MSQSPKAPHALGVATSCFVALGLLGCDGAFSSRSTSTRAGVGEIALTFDDGSDSFAINEGEVVPLLVAVPRVGFRRLADAAQGSIDPDRLVITSDRDLGDVSQGGIPAGTNLSAFFLSMSWIAIESPPDLGALVRITLDTQVPFPFPPGLMKWRLEAVDDIDVVHGPFEIELTVRALDRPTLLLRLEIPPASRTPSGLSLPTDADGVSFVGEQLPFVIALEGIPNPQSGTGFTKLFGPNGIDPSRLVVVADRDLGDGSGGGFFAGDNLASIVATDLDFIVDPASGSFLTGALFAMTALYSPALGETRFQAFVLDDADAAASEQSVTIRVEAPVTLSTAVQPLYDNSCIFCHLPPFPILELDLFENAYATTVGVRAEETPDDSCATLRIAPYEPQASYLFHKVAGTHLDGCVNGTGVRMPESLAFWTDEEIATLERWILQGAHDN